MITPPALVPGDTIAIIPTARAISEEELRDGIALAQSWGLKVKLGAGIGRKAFQQAGSASARAADLQAALNDDAVKAVWCARGGYGTVQLLEHLDLSVLRNKPKWIIGFSDVTVLHSALQHIGVCSLHAQMPFNIGDKTPSCIESLKAALFNAPQPVRYAIQPGTLPMHPGTVEGLLTGGNISVLLSLRGTPMDLDPTGKILFLEDLDELLYHFDRMVMNLKLGCWFSKLAGWWWAALRTCTTKIRKTRSGFPRRQLFPEPWKARPIRFASDSPLGISPTTARWYWAKTRSSA